jgi:hypothetical protein
MRRVEIWINHAGQMKENERGQTRGTVRPLRKQLYFNSMIEQPQSDEQFNAMSIACRS